MTQNYPLHCKGLDLPKPLVSYPPNPPSPPPSRAPQPKPIFRNHAILSIEVDMIFLLYFRFVLLFFTVVRPGIADRYVVNPKAYPE